MHIPAWTHVQPLLIPKCSNCRDGYSIETKQRQHQWYGLYELITVYYTCTECHIQYAQLYKLSNGAPGIGISYLSPCVNNLIDYGKINGINKQGDQ